MKAALFLGAVLLPWLGVAASCCGGGSSSSLVLPKFGKAELSTNVSMEKYDGFWDGVGKWTPDPAGSKLYQYRWSLGGAYRLADRWQMAAAVPFVWNDNNYTGIHSQTTGLGDAALTLRYETFDDIKCVWSVETLEDLMPAIYLSTTLNLPTGISPYDKVNNNFDITGRGFYRLDGNILLDKTIYPWNMSANLTYGTHFSRPVNSEYGNYVKPYRKKLGDRANVALSGGYTYFSSAMASWTGTVTYADLWEGKAVIDGAMDPTSGLRKRSVSFAVAWAPSNRDWILNGSWNHAIKMSSWGRNFPTTDIFTMGVSYVFR